MNTFPIRVLLVEDHEDDALLIRAFLSAIPTRQFDVQGVNSFSSARRLLAQHHFDVCLLDDRVDGAATLEILKELPDGEVPFVVLTENEEYETDVAAARAGAADYLVKKHLNAPLLERSIRYAIERKKTELSLLQAQRFAQATVDALPDNIAVLDSEGRIVAVNTAWREFASNNKFHGSDGGMGANYLEVCDRSEAPDARLAADGIRAVMAGQEEFRLQYPCFSPTEQRWFRLSVSRFSGPGPVHVVVAHEDITEEKRVEESLRQSNELLQAVTEGATDAIFAKDRQGRYLMINAAGANFMGRSVEEIVGKTNAELASSETAQTFGKIDRLVLEEGIAQTREVTGTFEGVTFTFLANKSPMRGPDGQVNGIVGISRDITKRKQAEQALEERTREIITIWESMSDAFYSLDTDWRFTHVNSQAARHWGKTPEELIGKNIWEEFPAAVELEFYTQYHRARREGVATDFEAFYPPLDAWQEVHAYPSHLGLSVYFRDITHRKQAEEQLHFQKTLLQAQMEASPDGILVVSSEGKILSYNQRYLRMWNVPAEVIGSRDEAGVRQIVLDQVIDPDGFWQRVTYLLGHREEHTHEEIMLRDGRIFDRHSAPVLGEGGTHHGRVWYFHDITHRKRAQDALLHLRDELEERVEERTHELEQSNLSLQGEILERERAEREMRAQARQHETVAELGRRALLDIDLDTLLKGTVSLIAATLDIETCSFWERLPQSDLLQRRVGIGLRPEEMLPIPEVTIGDDVQVGYTARLGEPVISEDLEHETRFAMHSFLRNKGINSTITVPVQDGELYGVLAAGSPHKKSFSQNEIFFLQTIANVLSSALKRKNIEAEIRQLNEGLQEANEKLRMENIERQMTLSALRGATEVLKQAKEEAESAREEAEAAREEAEAAREEAERANRAKSEFLSRMSHELRTPLNAVLGFGQILDMRAREPQDRENIRQILKAGRHLLGLINEVLDIARIESGNMSLSLEPIPAGIVVQEALDLVRPLASARNVSLFNGVMGDNADKHLLADQQRFKQVMLNLMSNAVKYNRENGAVFVGCEVIPAPPMVRGGIRVEGQLRFFVRDTGAGLSEEDISKLFVPFERLGAARTQIEGTGIGLTLCKRLVEAMNGQIGVISEVGEGSTFWVELPLVSSPLEGAALEASPLDEPVASLEERKTILYIEDNLSNINLIEQALREHQVQVKFLTAMQGSVGLELAAQHRPDLILLDVHLPDILGDAVLRRLKDDAKTRDIPVVVLSADATPSQVERLMAGGARAYLTKPLDLKRFFEVLEQEMKAG
jgi:PAS domain S-box-containing protein